MYCPYRSCRISGKCLYPDRADELGCPKDPRCSDEEYDRRIAAEERFMKLVEQTGELEVTVLASSKYPPDGDSGLKWPDDFLDCIVDGPMFGEEGYTGEIDCREYLEYPCNCDNCRTVHVVDYASQPDIQFRCDGQWSRPHPDNFRTDAVKKEREPGVYEASNGYLYTFDEEKATCKVCEELRDSKPHYPR